MTTLEKVRAALLAAHGNATLDAELQKHYGEVLSACYVDGRQCDWIRAQIQEDLPQPVVETLRKGLAHCDDDWSGPPPAEGIVKEALSPSLTAWLSKNGDRRPELASALEKCAKQVDRESAAFECLGALAFLDWKRAKALSPLFKNEEVWQRERAAALRAFDSADDLREQLVERGFLLKNDTPQTPVGQVLPTTVRDVLRQYGRMQSFDTETDRFPNGHDELMSLAARLTRPQLEGGFFEELPPGESIESWPPTLRLNNPRAKYDLRLYSGGKRYRAPAEDLGDWFDTHAVVGLVNAALRDAGRPGRILLLDEGGQDAGLVAVPASQIGWILKTRLLEPLAIMTGEETKDAIERGLKSLEGL